MTFTRSELEMIYQYAATDRAATVAGLAEIVPVLKDPLTKAIVKNTIDKLEKIPEPECSCFIADIKARCWVHCKRPHGERNLRKNDELCHYPG